MSAKIKAVGGAGACLGIAIVFLVPSFVCDDRGVQRPACINNLRQIEMAKHQWAGEHHVTTNDTPSWNDLQDYLKPQPWKCPNGGTYNIGRIGELPTCSIAKDTAYWRGVYRRAMARPIYKLRQPTRGTRPGSSRTPVAGLAAPIVS